MSEEVDYSLNAPLNRIAAALERIANALGSDLGNPLLQQIVRNLEDTNGESVLPQIAENLKRMAEIADEG